MDDNDAPNITCKQIDPEDNHKKVLQGKRVDKEDGLGWSFGRRTVAFGHPARMNYYKHGPTTRI